MMEARKSHGKPVKATASPKMAQSTTEEAIPLLTTQHTNVLPSSTTPQAVDSAPAIVLNNTTIRYSSHNAGLPLLQEPVHPLSTEGDKRNEVWNSLTATFRNAKLEEGMHDLELREQLISVISLTEEAASSGDGAQDNEALRAVAGILQAMLETQSRYLVSLAKSLAEASRTSVWRNPFGENGILKVFLYAIASTDTPNELVLYALRLIGNVCAENDANKLMLLEYDGLRYIIQQLENPSLIDTAIPVLYNICVDSEPAQKTALTARLYPKLLNILEQNALSSQSSFSYLCQLIDLFTTGFKAEISTGSALRTLLGVLCSTSLEVDDFLSLVGPVNAHLKFEQYQFYLISQDIEGLALALLTRSYSPLEPSLKFPWSESLNPLVYTAEEQEELSSIRCDIVEALSNVSCCPEFTAKYSAVNSALTNSLFAWLSVPIEQVQECACIMLGNLARSDLGCRAMVSQHKLHADLLNLVKKSSDMRVLYSSLCLLKNLCVLPENTLVLVDAGIIPAIARFWTTETVPQVTLATTTIARRVVSGSLDNVSKLLALISAGKIVRACSTTYFSLLLLLFEKSDDFSVKTDIGRTVAAILRSVHSSDAKDAPDLRQAVIGLLYSLHPTIGQPLGLMVLQKYWPVVCHEGWFAMALMARTAEGSSALELVFEKSEVFGALEATIRSEQKRSNVPRGDSTEQSGSAAGSSAQEEGKPAVEQAEELKANSRDNARVLITGLLKNKDFGRPNQRRSLFEDLLCNQA